MSCIIADDEEWQKEIKDILYAPTLLIDMKEEEEEEQATTTSFYSSSVDSDSVTEEEGEGQSVSPASETICTEDENQDEDGDSLWKECGMDKTVYLFMRESEVFFIIFFWFFLF